MKRTIEVSEETYQRIKDQLIHATDVEINSFEDMIGKSFLFRTVTYHCVGKVEKQIGQFFELSTASWVADSGRFMQCIKEGSISEVEPVGKMYVNMSTVVDFFPWVHKLPTQQK